MLQMRLIIHGSVQGVGYRYSIIDMIESHQVMVTGYIKNHSNGTVEIVAEGDIEVLKDIRRFANEGSSRSVVRDIEESLTEIFKAEYTEFSIDY